MATRFARNNKLLGDTAVKTPFFFYPLVVSHRHVPWGQVGDLSPGHFFEVWFLDLDVQQAQRVHTVLCANA